jgi:hypothetical protein
VAVAISRETALTKADPHVARRVFTGGLCRIDNPGGDRPRLAAYTKTHALASDVVLSVTGDVAGRIYVSTSRCIDRLDPKTGRVKHYSTADGLTG